MNKHSWPDFKCLMCDCSIEYQEYSNGDGYCKACAEILDAEIAELNRLAELESKIEKEEEKCLIA
jgi:hypothetical protein